MLEKIKKWAIAAGTTALLIASGVIVGTFDPEKGYPLLKPNGDTLWVHDSLTMVKLSTGMTRTKTLPVRWDGKNLLATTEKYEQPSMVGADTVAKMIPDTLVVEQSNDSVTIEWYDENHYYVIPNWRVITAEVYNHTGIFDLRYVKQFLVGSQYALTGYDEYTYKIPRRKDPWTIDYNAGTYKTTICRGYKLDPGYSVASKPASAILDTTSGTANQPDTVELCHLYLFNVADTSGGDVTDRGNAAQNNGTLTNGAYVDEAEGVFNGGVVITTIGDDDYVNFGNISEFSSTSKFTISFWMKKTSYASNEEVFNVIDGVSDRIRIIFITSALRVYIENGSTPAYYEKTGWNGLKGIGVYGFYVIQFDGTQADNASRLKVWLDGVQVTASSFSGTIPSTTSNLAADAKLSAASNGSLGSFDVLAIYCNEVGEYLASGGYAATRERYLSSDTCRGFAEADTATRDQEVDSVFYWTEGGADTLVKLLSDGLVHDISALWGASANKRDTVYVMNANNVGRSTAVKHLLWVFYNNSTSLFNQIGKIPFGNFGSTIP